MPANTSRDPKRAVLDENVSREVSRCLEALGYEVHSLVLHSMRGMGDEAVFSLACEKRALLITRDIHFTNSVRFPPSQAGGILYLTQGNLRSSGEARLVASFLQSHVAESFEGRLVFLSPAYVSIR